MTHNRADSSPYLLGDSPSERERLNRQADRLRALTERFLHDAGIVAGMRVLELGCGTGHVTQQLARLVGPSGLVVALDRSPAMLAHAHQDLRSQAPGNVQFVECDLSKPPWQLEGLFDALVGRLILTHLPDPVGVLRHALEHVTPGGVVAFQEADCTLADCLLARHQETLRLVRKVNHWINFARKDAMNPHMGLQLYHVFKQVGLPGPTIDLHTELHGGPSADRIRNTTTILKNLLPRLEELGIEGAEMDLPTLEERLAAETAASDVVQARISIASAWALKPSA